MKLVLPSTEYEKSFRQALKELKKQPSLNETERGLLSRFESAENFAEFVKKLRGQAKGKYLPNGFVPSTTYWLVDGKKFIGRVSIRHRLNTHLCRIGGHIGYVIRPSERKKGYGTVILKLALAKTRELGIKKVLVTCGVDNIGSRRIIEANGGIFQNIAKSKTEGDKRRYWIHLRDQVS